MHTMDAACSCACLDVLWSVCELIATVSPAKTAKPIEMPSGEALVGPGNRMLDVELWLRVLANMVDGSESVVSSCYCTIATY